jgi:hypothetical protein
LELEDEFGLFARGPIVSQQPPSPLPIETAEHESSTEEYAMQERAVG